MEIGPKPQSSLSTLPEGFGKHSPGASAIAWTRPISLQSRLLLSIALPLLMRKNHDLELFRQLVQKSQAAGLPEAPNRLRKRLQIERCSLAGMDCLRVIARKGHQPRRRVLYLHGGAYVYRMAVPHWTLIAGMAEQTGAEIIVPAYPLAPDHDVLQGIAAVEEAYRFLQAEGPEPIALAGDSAGAGLALALTHALRDSDRKMPAALVLFFPWLDVTLSDPEQDGELERRDITLSNTILRTAGKMWAGALDPADPRPSPLFGDQHGLPPTLALGGGRDVLVADTRRFATACPAAVVLEYPEMFHGWICVGTPEGKAALMRATQFLDHHFA